MSDAVATIPAPVEISEEQQRWLRLSNREVQVAMGIFEDVANGELAERLGISTKTLDTHRGHIRKKLGVRSNVGIVRMILRLKLAEP